jgi:hypothetical protein
LSRSSVISVAFAALALCSMPAPALAYAHNPGPAPTATPTLPPEDPAITTVARREFVAWQAGVVDRSHYSAQTQGLTDEKIADTSKALSQYGALLQTQWAGPLGIQDAPSGVKGYVYKMICTGGMLYELLTIGPDGKVDGVIFRNKLPTQ